MPGDAAVFEKAIGFAKESGTWPPTTPTSPTLWLPSFDDIDLFQYARALDVPEGSGTRERQLRVPSPYFVSGRISGVTLTPEFLAFLFDLLLGEYDLGYYYPILGQPPSCCVTFQKGGHWFNALGAKIRSATLRYAAEEFWRADIEFAAYSCPPRTLAAPSPSFGTIHVYPGWNTKFYVNGSEIKVRSFELTVNNNIPEAMHCSGDRYSYYLGAGEVAVEGTYNVEFEDISEYTQQLNLTEFSLKAVLLDENGNNEVDIHLPRCHGREKPDFSDEENLVFIGHPFEAKTATSGVKKLILVKFK